MIQTAPVKILVLEDDEELRGTLEAVLSAEGYEVVCAAGGQEAVQAAMEQEFDLVVTDIRMPGMDGLQALEEMRRHCGDIESLVVTGYSTEEDSIRAIRLGAGDYLTKPFKLDEFLHSVETLLGRRREAARRREEERSLRHSLLWATQLLANLSDRRVALRASQSIAQRLSALLQLGAEASESIQLAVLLSGLQTTTEVDDSTFGPSLPRRVTHILENLEERWDGAGVPQGLKGTEIPLEARVAAVALARLKDEDGRLDMQLVSLLDEAEAGPVTRPPAMPGSQARGLVSLARALEKGGNQANARVAFEKVVEDGGPTREKLDALHGLARLACLSGDTWEAGEFLKRALDLAELLGPLSSASSHLQAGLHFHLNTRQSDEARALLHKAMDLYQRLALRGGQAHCVLALAAAGEKMPLDTLERAAAELAGQSGLSDVADWLLPFALRASPADIGAGKSGWNQLLRRLLRGAPRDVLRLLQHDRLDPSARRNLASWLAHMEGDGPQALLRFLSADAQAAVREAATAALSQPAAEGPPAATVLRVYTLGPLEAYWGEERINESDWKSRKVKQLFAMLASQRGRPVSEDRLVDTFWPDDMERGKKNLNWTLSALRKALRAPLHTKEEAITRNVGGISLNPQLPRWHDLEQVEDLINAGQAELRTGPLERPERFHSLLELYRGPYLEECYLDWALAIRTRLENQMVPLLQACAGQFQARQQHQEALEFLNCLLGLDPLHQEACLATMQAYLALRRPEQAVRQFKLFRDRLQRELNMEPTIELLEAHQRALLQCP